MILSLFTDKGTQIVVLHSLEKLKLSDQVLAFEERSRQYDYRETDFHQVRITVDNFRSIISFCIYHARTRSSHGNHLTSNHVKIDTIQCGE
jgi:hypothetical protein